MLALGYNFWSEWGLQEKVDFDGINRLIIVYPHVTALSIRADVWSAWIRWHGMDARAYDRYTLAMERTGLDVTPIGELGNVVFLRNNWKLLVDLSKVKISEVLFSRDFDTAYYTYDLIPQYPAEVALVVNETKSASGLSDEQSIQLEELHGQADRSVYLDPLVDVTGDGSMSSPFKTPNEAVDYVELNGVRGIKLFNNLELAKPMRNVFVEGINLPEFNPAGFGLKGTKLLNVRLTGTSDPLEKFIIQQSIIENDAGLNGFVEKCTFSGNCSLTGHTHIVNSFSNKPGADYINLDTNGYILQVTNWRRSLGISNMTSGTHTIEMYGGQLHLDAGCLGGIIYLRGNYSKPPNNLGTTVIIDETESLVTHDIRAAEMNRRQSVGLVDTIYEDDGVTPRKVFDITKDGSGNVVEIVPQ